MKGSVKNILGRKHTLDDGALHEGVARGSGRTVAGGYVVADLANSSHATSTWTGINAFAALAGLVSGTVRVEDALWTTSHIGIAIKACQTRALPSRTADGVGATRRGVALVAQWGSWRRGSGLAADEGVALIAGWATADRRVVDDVARGTESARAGAGIATFLIDTRQMGGAVRINHALRLAIGWCSKVASQAGAHSLIALGAALTKDATGRGNTGIAVGLLGGIVADGGSYKGVRVRVVAGRAEGKLHLTYAAASTDGITRKSRQAAAMRTVVDNPTLSIAAAHTWTGIDAVLLDAGQGSVALAGNCALGPAGRRGSDEVGQARADGLSVRLAALGVGSAGRWLAGTRGNRVRKGWRDGNGVRFKMGNFSSGGLLTFTQDTAERIGVSMVAHQTAALRKVIPDLALGVQTAGSWAGIATMLILAGQVTGAVRVENTFWATALIRIAEELRQTLASSGTIPLRAHGIGAARAGHARVLRFGNISYHLASEERIAGMATDASAHGSMVDDVALGIRATHAWAGIAALLIEASQVGGALRVGNTFRPAVGRSADKSGQAAALGVVALGPAHCIGAARRWLAGIDWVVVDRRRSLAVAGHEWISGEGVDAVAVGAVVHHPT